MAAVGVAVVVAVVHGSSVRRRPVRSRAAALHRRLPWSAGATRNAAPSVGGGGDSAGLAGRRHGPFGPTLRGNPPFGGLALLGPPARTTLDAGGAGFHHQGGAKKRNSIRSRS
jgi:hypothetical protein